MGSRLADLIVVVVSFVFVLIGVVALVRRKWLLGGIALGAGYVLMFAFLAFVGLLVLTARR